MGFAVYMTFCSMVIVNSFTCCSALERMHRSARGASFYQAPSETRVHHASLRLFDIRIPLLDEAPDECERRVSNVSPAAVNRQRVPAIGDRDNLSNADIPLLTLERRVRDLPRDRIVLLTRDNQQWPPLWALDVDICLRPRVEVSGRCLKDWRARCRNSEGRIDCRGLFLADGVCEAEPELDGR